MTYLSVTKQSIRLAKNYYIVVSLGLVGAYIKYVLNVSQESVIRVRLVKALRGYSVDKLD